MQLNSRKWLNETEKIMIADYLKRVLLAYQHAYVIITKYAKQISFLSTPYDRIVFLLGKGGFFWRSHFPITIAYI